MLLNLPLPPGILDIINNNYNETYEVKSTLHGCIEYLVDNAMCDISGGVVDISDYIPINTIYGHNELVDIIENYTPYVLNELVINNITNPYVCNADPFGFTMCNKEENM